MHPITAAMTTLASATAALAATTAIDLAGPAADHPPSAVDAAPAGSDFQHPAANPWFPLAPGTVWTLRGRDEGRRYAERVVVTHRHRTVAGVRVRVVRDVLRRADGSVAERTNDWYAVDRAGTVWYFGERTAELDRRGHVVSREGSWEAGVDGAVAGRIMPVRPRVTDAFRQELRRGVAEDQAWVVERGAHVRTPAVRTGSALRTLEWSRLEPDVVSEKLYVRGFGLVAERDLAGGSERFRLVRVRRP